jgi:NAD(P)-dependent dehydrogenase (short-subunit alcohol dehydrogenase family)
MRLRNKVALITGGGSGLGRGIALRFGQEGAAVVLFGRRLNRLGETADLIGREGGVALPLACDVSDAGAVARMVEMAAGHLGRLDILVNAAGVRGAVGDVTEISLPEWDEAFRVNTTGPMLCARSVIPHMRRAGGGAILNIGSMRLSHVKPGAAAYCASKGALLYLTKVMALDHAADQIRVNMISPGLVLTDLTRYVVEQFPTPEEGIRRYGAQYPLGRIGTEDDIANAAVYLCSDESSWVTGAILPVDGGLGTT